MRLGRSRPIPALLLRRAAQEPPVSATASLGLVATVTTGAQATASASLGIGAGSVTAAAPASATASLVIGTFPTAKAAAQAPAATAALSINATHVALPWTEDFSGGDWSRWTTSLGRIPGNIANALTVSAGAGVLATSNPGSDGGARAYPAGVGNVSSTTDQGVLLTLTPSANATSNDRMSVILRGNGAWGAANTNTTAVRPGTGYRVEFVPNSFVQLHVDSSNGTVDTTPTLSITGTPTVVVVPGSSYYLRFEVIGARLQVRNWLVGNAEPTTWAATSTDDFTAATGIFGLAAYFFTNTATYTVDDISWYGIAVPASATASLSIVATAIASSAGTSTAALTISGSAIAQVPDAGTAVLVISAGPVTAAALDTTTASMTLNSTGTARAVGTSTASLTMDATGTARVTSSSTASLVLNGLATARAAGASTAAMVLNAIGTARAAGASTAAMVLSATGTARAPVSSTGSMTLDATGIARAAGSSTAAMTIAATGTARAAGTSTATLAVVATGVAQASATELTAALAVDAGSAVEVPVTTTATLTLTAVLPDYIVAADNDLFANRRRVWDSQITGSTVGYTTEPGEVMPSYGLGPATAWFEWVAPVDGSGSFSIVESDFLAWIGIWYSPATPAVPARFKSGRFANPDAPSGDRIYVLYYPVDFPDSEPADPPDLDARDLLPAGYSTIATEPPWVWSSDWEAWVADCGPYMSTDWPPDYPADFDLEFAGEVDFIVAASFDGTDFLTRDADTYKYWSYARPASGDPADDTVAISAGPVYVGTLGSPTTLFAAAGQHFYIQISGEDGAQGNYVLNFSPDGVPPDTPAVSAVASGTGELSLGASAAAEAGAGLVVGTAELTLIGFASATATDSSNATLALAATAIAAATSTSTGTLTLAATATARVSSTSTASLTLVATATPAVRAATNASLVVDATAVANVAGTNTALLTIGSSATARVTASSTASLTLAATATASTTATATMTLGGTATARAALTSTAALVLAAVASATFGGTSTASLTLAADGTAQVGGSSSAALSLVAIGAATVATTSTATLSLAATGTAVVVALTTALLDLAGTGAAAGAASAEATLVLSGVAITGVAQSDFEGWGIPL